MWEIPKIEISNAVRNPQLIRDPFFTGCTLLQRRTTPEIQEWSGGFSMTYCIEKDGERWAFKIWNREIKDNRVRYKKIMEHLTASDLPYFSDFGYTEDGLIVPEIDSNKVRIVDTFRMKWINGTNLKEYISANLRSTTILENLAQNFLVMTEQLHDKKIAHGDLKNDNIFITPNGDIKLIDYDSICVPNIDGHSDICRGTNGFQHPSRITAGTKASLKNDYFSELIIYLSILATIENPLLWDTYHVDQAEYRLLFTPEDFIMWQDAPIRHDLNLLSQKVKDLVQVLEGYLASHLYFSPFGQPQNL